MRASECFEHIIDIIDMVDDDNNAIAIQALMDVCECLKQMNGWTHPDKNTVNIVQESVSGILPYLEERFIELREETDEIDHLWEFFGVIYEDVPVHDI